MNIAIVTGASSGMGAECVKQITKVYDRLDEIWIIARRMERLCGLSLYSDKVKIRPIPIDITNEGHMEAFNECMKDVKPKIRMLVNAAGMGIIGRFDEEDYIDEIGMVDLNCRALTAFTKMCLPFMHKNSRIINFASSAAFLPQPDFAVYAASKAYVLSFSRALNKELKNRGIYVTAVCPGPVATDFFKIAEKHHKMPGYKKLALVRPEAVVEKAFCDSLKKRDVSVYSFTMNSLRFFTKVLPHSLFLYFWKEGKQ